MKLFQKRSLDKLFWLTYLLDVDLMTTESIKIIFFHYTLN